MATMALPSTVSMLATRAAFPLPVRAMSMEMVSAILSLELTSLLLSETGQSYVIFGQKDASTSSSTYSAQLTPPGSSINIGAIVGGVLGGTLLIAAAATVVVLKVLKKGCFSDKTTDAPSRMNKNNQAIFNDDNL